MTPAQLRNYQQYLQNYAEPEARILQLWLKNQASKLWNQFAVVSVPLCEERERIRFCLDHLISAAALNPAVVIFVVNNRQLATDERKADNQATLEFLQSRLTTFESPCPGVFCGYFSENLYGVVIDRCSDGREIPEGQGVGMARKIGCDVAAVFLLESTSNERFLRNTDGDAMVAPDYFAMIPPGPAAAIYRFQHVGIPDGIGAVFQYEMYLYYYVRGLSFAGSSYAFQTVGSTIACDIHSYISCRGFPKREAGEDFYLLNKLAKVGTVVELSHAPIILFARDSDRVPFGTGASCRKIEGIHSAGDVYKAYHPDCFGLLKIWLGALAQHLGERDPERIWQAFVDEAGKSFAVKESIFTELDESLHLRAGLRDLVKKSPKVEALQQHARIWFDAFRSMRFLNIVRDRIFGELPVSQLEKYFL